MAGKFLGNRQSNACLGEVAYEGVTIGVEVSKEAVLNFILRLRLESPTESIDDIAFAAYRGVTS